MSTTINIQQNAYFTVRCAEILEVSPVAPGYAITKAYLAARDAAEAAKHLIQMAHDWLSLRSMLQRQSDVRTHEQAAFKRLDEVSEMQAITAAVHVAKKKASSFVGYYSIFAGCNITTKATDGRSITVQAPGQSSGMLG